MKSNGRLPRIQVPIVVARRHRLVEGIAGPFKIVLLT